MGKSVRPLGDRVVIKRIEEDNKSIGGIYIPDSAAEKPDQGVVISVGPGKLADDGKLLSMNLKVGDTVVFGKYAGQSIKLNNEELLIMREDDVMGIVVAE